MGYRFCIHVPGQMDNGINSNLRGEGRWTLNMGVVLAENGHDVTIIGNPGKGDIPGCKHVTWGTVSRSIPYDFFLDGTWFKAISSRNTSIPAKAYIRCFWGVDHQYDTIRTEYDFRHFGAYPTLEVYGNLKSHPNSKFAKFLPIPIIRKFEFKNNFDKKYIIWPAKTPFEFEHKVGLSEYVVTTLLDYCSSLELTPIILFLDHHKSSHRCGKFTPKHIEARVSSLPNKIVFKEGCKHEDVLSLLDNSKAMFTNGAPPASPMFVEAVAKGCIPLCWNRSLFGEVPEKFGLRFKDHNGKHFYDNLDYFTTEVSPAINKLMNDREFYLEVLSAYREEVKHHTYNEAYKVLINSFKSILDEVDKGR